jgi:hypothetical protein
VLASADSDAFTSLRRPTSRRDRYRIGRGLRRQVPANSLGKWLAYRGWTDPVQLIIKSHDGRLDRLIRSGRADDRHAVRILARRGGGYGSGCGPAARVNGIVFLARRFRCPGAVWGGLDGGVVPRPSPRR